MTQIPTYNYLENPKNTWACSSMKAVPFLMDPDLIRCLIFGHAKTSTALNYGWEIIAASNGAAVVLGMPGDWYWLDPGGPDNTTPGAIGHYGQEGLDPFSWIIVKNPGSTDQLLFARDFLETPGCQAWNMWWSPSGVFVGGTINTKPTAVDAIALPPLPVAAGNLVYLTAVPEDVGDWPATCPCPSVTFVAEVGRVINCFFSLEFFDTWHTLPTGNKCVCTGSYAAGVMHSAMTYVNKSSTTYQHHTVLSDGTYLAWAATKSLNGAAVRNRTATAKGNLLGFDPVVGDGAFLRYYAEPIALVKEDGVSGIVGFLRDRWWGPEDSQYVHDPYTPPSYQGLAVREWETYRFNDVLFWDDEQSDIWADDPYIEPSLNNNNSWATVKLLLRPAPEPPVTDVTPPTFGGITGILSTDPWAGPNDLPWVMLQCDPGWDAGGGGLIYEYHMSKTPNDPVFRVVGRSTDLSGRIEDLEYSVTYYCRIRVRDMAGNYAVDGSDLIELPVTTRGPYLLATDQVLPLFAGIVSAQAQNENTIRVAWAAGEDPDVPEQTDMITPTAKLVYEVHCSTTPSDTWNTRAESAPGATFAFVRFLKPGILYYFRVRCRTLSGNRSVNNEELSAQTQVPGPARNIVSRQDGFLPGYELAWSATHYDYNDADRYTGFYYDGTAYNNILAAVGKRILCLKQALVSTGWTVEQSSTTTHVAQSDLWTNAPDVERGAGHWIVLRGPDGVSQLVIQKDYLVEVRCFYFYWSPGGLFTTGTLPSTRPTAIDEIGPSSGASTNIGYVAFYPGGPTTGAFYGFRGLRGAEITSRVLQIDTTSTGKIEFMFCLDWFVTDLSEEIYPRNICTFAFNTGYGKAFFDKDYVTRNLYYCRVTMPDGKFALPVAMWCPFIWPGHWPSEYAGAKDAKSRMLPMYLQERTEAGDHQFFGYIPDMYFGNNDSPLFSWYGYRTFGGTWSRYAELCLPIFATDYATNLGDAPSYALVVATANDSVEDELAPTFAGITGITLIDGNTIRITWDSGYDNTSMHESLTYQIHCATSEGADFQVRGEVLGELSYDMRLYVPNIEYFFRVRCKDEAGNIDANTEELSMVLESIADVTSPTVTVESPPPRSVVYPPDTIIVVIADERGLQHASVFAEYPDSKIRRPRESVYDGGEFEPRLFGGSELEVLVPGKAYRLYLRRTGGWPAAPHIRFAPIDTSGNEIT